MYPLFQSGSNDNKSNYNNTDYDKLVADARKEIDDSEREKLYQKAEDVVLEDMPIMPMFWRTQIRLVKLDRFGGLAIDPFEDPTLRTAYIKGEASDEPSESETPTAPASPSVPASTEPPASPSVAPSPSVSATA